MRTIAGTTWSVEDARKRIRARVRVDERGCWIWQGAAPVYGLLRVPAKHVVTGCGVARVHRIAYDAFVGPIREGDGYHGTCVLHRCDVPACCNPEHLFLGTNADNTADKVAKGRARGGAAKVRGSRNGRSRLTAPCVRLARRMIANGISHSDIGQVLGVGRKAIRDIHVGRTWAHVLDE